METKYYGCLLAAACGDALGYPVEFRSDASIRKAYGEDGITEMDLRAGKALISDDTQMSIYTAQGLIHGKQKGCDYHQTLMEIYKSYLRWIVTQGHSIYPSQDGVYTMEEIQHNDDLAVGLQKQSLSSSRAPGLTCCSALESGAYGTRERRINDSKGCGGIMRVAPIAIAYSKDQKMAYAMACDASLLTHCHDFGYTPSGALVLILAKLFSGMTLEDSIMETITDLKDIPECAQLVPILEEAVQLARDGVPAKKAYQSLGEGWVAEETLAIAIWAALSNPTDLKKAVVESVNHSGDSDSTGCVCGAIMGAALGREAIPPSWLENLELKELIIKQTSQLCTLYGV